MATDGFHKDLSDYFKKRYTLTDIEWHVFARLDNSLSTPNFRRRSGIEVADPQKGDAQLDGTNDCSEAREYYARRI